MMRRFLIYISVHAFRAVMILSTLDTLSRISKVIVDPKFDLDFYRLHCKKVEREYIREESISK